VIRALVRKRTPRGDLKTFIDILECERLPRPIDWAVFAPLSSRRCCRQSPRSTTFLDQRPHKPRRNEGARRYPFAFAAEVNDDRFIGAIEADECDFARSSALEDYVVATTCLEAKDQRGPSVFYTNVKADVAAGMSPERCRFVDQARSDPHHLLVARIFEVADCARHPKHVRRVILTSICSRQLDRASEHRML
jgi:hypothetical protein